MNYYNKNNYHRMQTTDFLNILLINKEKIKVFPTKSFWYEFDDYADFNNFNKKYK